MTVLCFGGCPAAPYFVNSIKLTGAFFGFMALQPDNNNIYTCARKIALKKIDCRFLAIAGGNL